jgi:hypothetical protein
MEITIKYDSQDIQAIQDIVTNNRNKTFLSQRIVRNVDGQVPSNTRENYWLTMAMCLLTTQQRSGPTSRISQFLLETPFRLSWEECAQQTDLEQFVRHELKHFGGIRFCPKIAAQVNVNYARLADGGWKKLEQFAEGLYKQRKSKPTPEHFLLEREAATYMDNAFVGFGPKQSRNFWQSLGLTRYEFVLDSRVLKWLRSTDFPIPLSSMALGEDDYYCFVSDILRQWCLQATVLPCVFDAAVFSSFDFEDWPENAPVY